jgi:hypothetical protein
MNAKANSVTKSRRRNNAIDLSQALSSLDARFERSIATANLLSVAKDHIGAELEDVTVSNAAWHLYRDLQGLLCDVRAVSKALQQDKHDVILPSTAFEHSY